MRGFIYVRECQDLSSLFHRFACEHLNPTGCWWEFDLQFDPSGYSVLHARHATNCFQETRCIQDDFPVTFQSMNLSKTSGDS